MSDLKALEAQLSQKEAMVGGIRAGCAKQVVWFDGPQKTKLSVVYVHGFSATLGEVRPLPDIVAHALGANLFYTRLAGHGQDGAAMGKATLEDWHADVAEALKVGAQIGEEVIVISCSTGCTLMTTALAQGAQIKASVHLSPNYGMRHIALKILLRMPGVERWGRFIAGREQTFKPRSDAHAQFWTLRYDTRAVFTMARAVREAMAQQIDTIKTPAYFAYCNTDRVVSPSMTRRVIARWAGPVVEDVLAQGRNDDTDGHVMAGDVMSPDQTAPLARRIADWVKTLG
ncbi:MAG: alpha/beta hydrolase [Octadecabacter sp.]